MKKQNEKLDEESQLHKKAEELLKKGYFKTRPPTSESAKLKIIHELEVHQIELELQNQELIIANENARLAHERYTELYDFAPSGYISLSKSGNINNLNFAAAAMLGEERSFLLNRLFSFFVSIHTRSDLNIFLKKIYETKVKQSCEIIIALVGKSTKHINIEGVISQDYKFCNLTLIDITKRKLAELKLQDEIAKTEFSEAKFRGIFNKVADAIFSYNPINMEIIEANEATSMIYGYSHDELIGLSCLAFSAEVEKSKSVAKDVIEKGSSYVNLRHHKKKDGTDIYVQIQVHKIMVNGEDIIFAVCKDITEKLKAEKALSRSETKFRALFEQSGGYCLILDPNTEDGIPIILDANEAACLKHGYTLEELVGRPVSYIDDEEGKKSIREKTAQIMKGKPIYFERVHARKDGTTFNVAVNAKRIDIEGLAPFIFTTEYDITKLKQFELDLIKAKEHAEESDRLKSAFLANMSHEIRTPMNGIVGFTNILLEEDAPLEERIKYLQIIDRNSQQLLCLIDDIIDIAKIESNELKITLSEYKISDILKDLEVNFNQIKLKLNDNPIALKLKIPSNYHHLTIKTDPIRIRQVISNLLTNAFKYSDKGTITFGFNTKETDIEIYVNDEGIGIPQDKLVEIFERFKQLNTENLIKLSGTGLGLAICRGIVERLGGKISVTSKLGVGSQFVISLPLN